MNRLFLSAVVIASGLALTPVVYAQAVSPTAPDQRRSAERARPLPGERIEARLAYAKTALKITPAQERQWNVLAEVLRKHAKAMDESVTAARTARGAGNQPQGTAIERLERRQQMMQAASARMSEVLEAAKPLYAAFNDEQKKEADALLNQRGGRGPHRSRWH